MSDRIFHKAFYPKKGGVVYLCNKVVTSHRVTDDDSKVNCKICKNIVKG